MRLAVIGSGIAGLTCAHVLGDRHETVLYESADRLGGHANTIDVDDPVAGTLGVDTGFIVHNDRNYPNLVRLFDELGVETIASEMSFAVTDRPSGFTYRTTNLDTIFADRSNLFDRRMWRLLADIARFYRHANRYLESGRDDLTLGRFLDEGRYSSAFVDLHLIPMGSAVWSADPEEFDLFPAAGLFAFLANHGLLGVGDRPQWRTVAGGSRTYVQALTDRYTGSVRLNTAVSGVSRADGRATVYTADGGDAFDRVILACHSDQALEMMIDPSPEEKEILGAIGYQPNHATLHTDTSLLSPRRKAWAAWNYDRRGSTERGAAVTYDLTTLQRLPGARRYLVSLNAQDRVDPAKVLAEIDYAHPVFDREAVDAQKRFDEIDGVNGTHFCGAYWGYGFHEDGIASALRACSRLGVDW